MSTYYETTTVIDSVRFGVASLAAIGGIWTIDGAEQAYGSPILPLAEYIPPNGSYFEDTIYQSYLYSSRRWTSPLDTIPPPIFIPNIIFPVSGNYYDISSYTGADADIVLPPGYEFRSYTVAIICWTRIRTLITPFSTPYRLKPNYIDLLSGYELDPRSIPNHPAILPSVDEIVEIHYYRENKEQSIIVRSIDWMSYEIDLKKGETTILPIKDCVLGTLYSSSQSVLNAIAAIPPIQNQYSYADLMPDNISGLFLTWMSMWESVQLETSIPANAVNYTIKTETSRLLRTIGANNDCWQNRSTATPNLNIDPTHPLFIVNNERAYDWHIKPQSDGSIGDLIMDSPRTIEIHAALNAGKWAVNPDDPTKPRKDNLGWRLNKLCHVLGIRVKPDGNIDKTSEDKLVRTIIDKDKKLDPKKIGVHTFAELGMVMKRINNRFKKDEIVSDQCVIVQDIPQLLAEYFEQINLALGIQESSAVQIKQGENMARFNSQLELLVELVNLMSSSNEMIRSSLVGSMISQSQGNEIIAGLGLPSVTKTIPVKIDKDVVHIPFKGIAPHRSISQEIATCTYNVGIVTGQLL